jgi:hypothetical protein
MILGDFPMLLAELNHYAKPERASKANSASPSAASSECNPTAPAAGFSFPPAALHTMGRF